MIFTALLILARAVCPYTQNIHQSITREAVNLLRKSFPARLSEMQSYAGTTETQDLAGCRIKTTGLGKLASGAWIEDEYDVVSCYGIGAVPRFDQPGFGLIVDATDNERKAFTCITHFWNADSGRNASTALHDSQTVSGIRTVWSFTVPENAYWKMMKYGQGPFHFRKLVYNPPDDVIEMNYCNGCRYATCALDEEWPAVTRAYQGQNYTVTGYYNIYTGRWATPSCRGSCAGEKSDAYEVLGRMCHLLQDMAVPEHAHADAHAGVNGMRASYYETHCPDFHQWSADELWNRGLTYINPFFQNGADADPLFNLMYLLNQIADHFASAGVNGDDACDPGFPFLKDILPALGAPRTAGEINEASCLAMHNILQPFAIRATAGLLYWFLVKTGQLPFQPYPEAEDIRDARLSDNDNLIFIGRRYLNLSLQGTFFMPSSAGAVACTGDNITLNPGFDARAGSRFLAYIDPGLNAVAVPASLPKEATADSVRETADLNISDDTICLLQNIPNPFNPSCMIRYRIPKGPCRFSLRIYDPAGKPVKTLEAGEKGPGRYSVSWDGTDDQGRKMPSGGYFCRLKASRFQKSVFMVMGK